MNLDQFKNEALAQKSVSKYGGENKWKDGGFLGQCVSLVNQYCWRVLNVPAGAWGDAYMWAKDSNVNRTYFDKASSPEAGDIGVSDGPTAEGHIWIYLSPTYILEQNGTKVLRVSEVNAYLKPSAILRIKNKGGVSILNQELVTRLFYTYLGRAPQKENASWIGKPTNDLVITLEASPERAAYAKRIQEALGSQKYESAGNVFGKEVFSKKG